MVSSTRTALLLVALLAAASGDRRVPAAFGCSGVQHQRRLRDGLLRCGRLRR